MDNDDKNQENGGKVGEGEDEGDWEDADEEGFETYSEEDVSNDEDELAGGNAQ